MDDHRSSLFNARKKKQDRRILRKSSTAAEAVLWTYLQNRKLLGKKFRRQSSVGPYIVDFYCPECRVAIELDGSVHTSFQKLEYDAERDRYLQELGIRVLRFENKAVFLNIEGLVSSIMKAVNV